MLLMLIKVFNHVTVSPKDRNYKIKHRNNVQGIAGTATRFFTQIIIE